MNEFLVEIKKEYTPTQKTKLKKWNVNYGCYNYANTYLKSDEFVFDNIEDKIESIIQEIKNTDLSL